MPDFHHAFGRFATQTIWPDYWNADIQRLNSPASAAFRTAPVE
jgi:hypothetical protein